MDFVSKHAEAMTNIEPRLEALETPINDPVRKQTDYGWWHTEIKRVDNA